jgi:hypothetical protein
MSMFSPAIDPRVSETDMNQEEMSRRYTSLSAEMQLRVLTKFGHRLTPFKPDVFGGTSFSQPVPVPFPSSKF